MHYPDIDLEKFEFDEELQEALEEDGTFKYFKFCEGENEDLM